MKPEQIEQVMTEVLEELKALRQQVEKGAWIMEQKSESIRSINDKIASIKTAPVENGTSGIEKIVNDGITQIIANVDAQPKKIVREFHIHLFPKSNIKEYYRTYSRLLFFLAIFLLIAGLVNMGTEWIKGYNERQKELQQHEIIQGRKAHQFQQENKKAKIKRGLKNTDSLNPAY